MKKTKKIETPTLSNDLEVRLLKGWQHPMGSFKEKGKVLTVTSDFGNQLISEGIAQLASAEIKEEINNN